MDGSSLRLDEKQSQRHFQGLQVQDAADRNIW